MEQSIWKKLSWLFLAALLAESFYNGLKFSCWSGTAACVLGFGVGFCMTRLKTIYQGTK
jgi:hypothetical protein